MPGPDQLRRMSTHMPSVLVFKGRPYLLFAAAVQMLYWKSYYTPLDGGAELKRIGFNTGHHVSECSPDGFVDAAGQVNLSITQDYRLTYYKGESLDSLTRVADLGPCLAATVLPDYRHIIYERASQPIYMRDMVGNVLDVLPLSLFRLPEHARVTRISFLCEDPDKILVTTYSAAGDDSFLLSLESKRAWRITAMGQRVYKCTIYQNKLIYAVRASARHEDRYLAETASFELMPV